MLKSVELNRMPIAQRLLAIFVGIFCLGATLMPKPAVACPSAGYSAEKQSDVDIASLSKSAQTVKLWAGGVHPLVNCHYLKDFVHMGFANLKPAYEIRYTGNASKGLYLQLDGGQHCEATLLVWAFNKWYAAKSRGDLPPYLTFPSAPSGRYVVFIGKMSRIYNDCSAELYIQADPGPGIVQ